jgi:hypothetical protein
MFTYTADCHYQNTVRSNLWLQNKLVSYIRFCSNVHIDRVFVCKGHMREVLDWIDWPARGRSL